MNSFRLFVLKALTPVGIVLGLGWVFREAVVDSILFTPHPAIVFIIFGMSGLGLSLLLLNLWHVWQDHQEWMELSALQPPNRAQRLQKLQRQKGRFSVLAGLLLESPRWDTTDPQSNCETELLRLQNSYNEALSFPAFLSGALVGMGLVGTFIGLLGALGDIADLISGLSVMNSQGGNVMDMFAQLVKQLQNPMKSMATAFVASLYGLLGSMTLGFSLFAHRKFVPLLMNQWRSLSQAHWRHTAQHADSPTASALEKLQFARTEIDQWKQLFHQLNAQYQLSVEHSQQMQQQFAAMFEQMQTQLQDMLGRHDEHHQESMQRQEAWHQELLMRQEARQLAMQEHTAQQVIAIQTDTRELALALRERNHTDALVRRALGEGEHWMQTLMQLQETASHFVANQQERSATEMAVTRAATDATQRLLDRLQRSEERQQRDVQQLALEVRELVSHMQRIESTAGQWSTTVLHTVQAHQVALHDSIAKLRTLLALEVNGSGPLPGASLP